MERTTIEQAKELFGKNFIGAEQLHPLLNKMGVNIRHIHVPEIHYSLEKLIKKRDEYILILGLSKLNNVDLSIKTFRNIFGVDSDIIEPCFYNQDWYLKEDFIEVALENRWYLLKKKIYHNSRAVTPTELLKMGYHFPSAILCTYAFFSYYYAHKELLWYHDFIWCSDVDHNGDRIYVGKYNDITGVNKNGFSIHRHLSLRNCYAAIDSL